MSTAPDVTSPAAHRAVTYATFSIGYNAIEGIVAVPADAVSGAVSLVGFGIDSPRMPTAVT